MARDRLAALRSQNSLDTPASSPQQPSNNRRSYPESPQRPPQQQRRSQYGDPRARPYPDSRSPPPLTTRISEPPRQRGAWSPEPFYDDRQGYSPYRSATASPVGMFSPQRVRSPDHYDEPPARIRSPTRMTSPPRDFDPNAYQPPRDFNSNDPDGGEVRHRNVNRRYAAEDEEDEKREYQYGSSSKSTNYTEHDGHKSPKRNSSEQDLNSLPILNKNKNTISRGEVPFEDMGDFFAEITTIQDDVKEANATIDLIQNLYGRYLACPSSEDVQALALHDQLANKTSSTRGLFASLRNRIHVLEQGNANLAVMIPLGQSVHKLSLSDVSVRQQQLQNIKSRFKDAVQRYAEVEKENRSKNRAKMERQVRIVYPQLSYEELQGIVRQAEMEGGTALFAQAVRSNGYRTRQAQSALREVQTRAAELGRIEETLVELAQMFADMATLVEAQDVAITKVEDDAREAQLDMEIGLENTKKAVHHARMARKRRWICFFIFMIIVVVLVIVLVLKVILPAVNKNKNNNDESSSSTGSTKVSGNSNSQGSKQPVVSGAVTVTVTTTVVVVRQPASLNALHVASPTSRQILMTVDTDALAAYALHSWPEPTFTPSSSSIQSQSPTPSSTRSNASRSSRAFGSTGASRTLAAASSPTALASSSSPSSASSSRSSTETHLSPSTSSRPASSSSARDSARTSASNTLSSHSRSHSSSQSSDRASSSRAESRSLTSTSRPSSAASSSSPRRSALSSHSHRPSSSGSHSHSPSPSSPSSSRPASSAVPRSSDQLLSARNSPIVSTSHSITSILKALLRRCTAAATPTILF